MFKCLQGRKPCFVARAYNSPEVGWVENAVVTDEACLDMDVSEASLVAVHIKFKPCANGTLSARMAQLAAEFKVL